MRKLIILLLIIPILSKPVLSMEYTAPKAPEQAQIYMPENTESFGDGLWFVLKTALSSIMPDVKQACSTCMCIVIMVLLLSILQGLSGYAKKVAIIVGAVSIGILILQSTNSLIQLGSDTIIQISEYGKLLIPVITAALASQGGVTASSALYAGTLFFSTLLTALIANVIVPLIYIYIAVSIADCVTSRENLLGIKKFVKWSVTWSIKIILYVCTGYLGITGVISGSADAAAVKAAKIAISGAVPVVGGILSDASETVLVSAGIMKNTVGIYGLIAVIAICIGPFLKIGIHYLLTKLTSAISSVFGEKNICILVQDLSGAMGLVLAMTGTACLLHLISIVCFMRGVT